MTLNVALSMCWRFLWKNSVFDFPTELFRFALLSVSAMPKFVSGQLLDGRFEIVRVCGEGYFSFVHLGVDTITGEKVAVKQKKDGVYSNMRAEFEKLVKLDPFKFSPSPIAYADDSNIEEFFVTSYEGSSLAATLSEHFSKTCAMHTVMQLLYHGLLALRDIHAKDLYHGDVSLNNLMCPENKEKGRLVLVDYGISRKYNKDGGRRDVMDLLNALRHRSTKDFDEVREKYKDNKEMTIDEVIALVQEKYRFEETEPFEWEI